MFKAVIEMPAGTKYKYEIHEDRFILDRPLSLKVPFNYGFITNTLAPDYDSLDVFVVSEEPIQIGAEVSILPVGILYCTDNGVEDNKIVAVLTGESCDAEGAVELCAKYLSMYKKDFVVFTSSSDAMSAIREIKKWQY